MTEEQERALGYQGKTNDFTVFYGKKAFLFECKASGLFFQSKRHASVDEIRRDVKKNLANPKDRSGLFQLYDKIQAAKTQNLPEASQKRFNATEEYMPIMLLYDEIKFANAPQALGNLLQQELETAGITGFKFQVWTIDELENIFKLSPLPEFAKHVAAKFNNLPEREWDLNTYLARISNQTYLRPTLIIPKGETTALKTLRTLIEQKPN
jgi:hypothetical protein